MNARHRLQRRLGGLRDDFRELVLELLVVMADQGVPMRVAQGARSPLQQLALYAQGRTFLDVSPWLRKYNVELRGPLPTLELCNSLRDLAGMPPIGRQEAERKVTNAPPGRSRHETGEAVDLVPMRLRDRLLPDWGWMPAWRTLGRVIHDQFPELRWGGDWLRQDLPHVELARREWRA